jgi:hypothetical protein
MLAEARKLLSAIPRSNPLEMIPHAVKIWMRQSS